MARSKKTKRSRTKSKRSRTKSKRSRGRKLNSYMKWFIAVRPELKRLKPNYNVTQLAKFGGSQWRSIKRKYPEGTIAQYIRLYK